jgi:hypothetical protein
MSRPVRASGSLAISAKVVRLCMEPSKELVHVGNMDALCGGEVKLDCVYGIHWNSPCTSYFVASDSQAVLVHLCRQHYVAWEIICDI